MKDSGKIYCSRPSETDSPRRDLQKQARVTHELSLSWRALVLSETMSRSSERHSTKREGVEALGCRCSFSPGEGWSRSSKGGLA